MVWHTAPLNKQVMPHNSMKKSIMDVLFNSFACIYLREYTLNYILFRNYNHFEPIGRLRDRTPFAKGHQHE
jgi:hypothetical protein